MAVGGDPGQLRQLFDRAITLTPDQRTAMLAELPLPTREMLVQLLEADRGATTYIEETIASELPSPPTESGQRFGPFETVELLGRGGMSSVFKARRVDGEVTQTVAIKVVDFGWLDPRALDRFRRERQFLAGLEHPNIARLIDGGTRHDGVAYVAMEYVEGERIDRYCDSHNLLIKDRLQLMLPLCDAVEHAHRKLIIHRDLKPSNVLVTNTGQPKLLDFGVAKALDGSAGSATQTLAFTPNFASPEQVRGEDVTTSTDVYGLGALLYFLLTARPPHQVDGVSAAALERAICEQPPTRPSSIHPELKGDLENILLKALHPEPARRYGSAREFAEDLERFLKRRPVLATPDSRLYRFRRFVERNRVASAAAALAILSVAGGTTAALYQAHRASQRFTQVRELANKFIFEFEASIRTTPGTIDARRKMAATARQYLADLAADSANDPGLQRELAESYFRLSEVETDTGERDAWLRDLLRSREILRSLGDEQNGAPEQRALYVDVLTNLAYYWLDRDPQQALPYSLEGLHVARAFRDSYPQNVLAWRAWVKVNMVHGATLSNWKNRIPESLQYLSAAVRIADEAHRKFPDDVPLVTRRVDAGNRFANVTGRTGRYEDALSIENETIAIFDRLIASHPEDPGWRDMRIKIGISRAAFLRRLAPANPAFKAQVLPAIRDVYLMARQNVERNPGNQEALDVQFVVISRYVRVLEANGQPEAALALRKEGEQLLTRLVEADPTDQRALSMQVGNLIEEAGLLNQLKRWRESETALATANQAMVRIEAKWPDDNSTLDDRISLLARQTHLASQTGNVALAREYCRRAFLVAQRLIAKAKDEKDPVSMLADLREDARQLHVVDPTVALAPPPAPALH